MIAISEQKRLAPFSGGNSPLDVDRFHQLCESGWFDDRRVELIDGEIYEKMPQGPLHSFTIILILRQLFSITPSDLYIGSQLPLVLTGTTELEPDCFVAIGDPRDATKRTSPLSTSLVIEVADTSLRQDRHRKGPIYAEAGIPEYWIVNPVARQVEIYRQPVDGEYQWLKVLQEGDSIAPLYRPDAEIAVDDLMPSPELSV